MKAITNAISMSLVSPASTAFEVQRSGVAPILVSKRSLRINGYVHVLGRVWDSHDKIVNRFAAFDTCASCPLIIKCFLSLIIPKAREIKFTNVVCSAYHCFHKPHHQRPLAAILPSEGLTCGDRWQQHDWVLYAPPRPFLPGIHARCVNSIVRCSAFKPKISLRV